MGHGPGRGMMPGEKAKDFTGTIQKLFAYLGSYRIVLGVVILFAIGSTVFNIIGPKVLSKVTTELFNGLVAKVSGTGGIDFEKIGRILADAGLYHWGVASFSDALLYQRSV